MLNRRKFCLALLAGIASSWLGRGSALADAKAPDFRIIVHPKNSVGSVSRVFLTDAFLKKKTRWDDDEAIRPVDREPKASVRHKFSKSVLKRSVAAVRSYWQQRIFSGRGVPPPELDSDDQVVAYVLKHEGAVGYVSGTAELHGAKVVKIR